MTKSISAAIALLLSLVLQISLISTARAQDVDPSKENKGERTTIQEYVCDVGGLMRQNPNAQESNPRVSVAISASSRRNANW